MKRFYFLLLPALACALLCACGNKNGSKPVNAQQLMLLGRWELQRENAVVYIDGAKQPATETDASNTGFSYLQFDAGNNYTSVSYYNSGGLGSISLGNVISVDTVKGTYSFSGTNFSLSSANVAGLGAITGTFSSGPLPVIHLVSHDEQIIQLTASALTLHIEYTTTQTINTDTKTYKNLFDYYYTK